MMSLWLVLWLLDITRKLISKLASGLSVKFDVNILLRLLGLTMIPRTELQKSMRNQVFLISRNISIHVVMHVAVVYSILEVNTILM